MDENDKCCFDILVGEPRNVLGRDGDLFRAQPDAPDASYQAVHQSGP